MNKTKKCNDCEQSLPLCSFQKDKRNADGLRSYCTNCKRLRRKEYYSKHKEVDRAGEYRRKYGITLEDYDKLLEKQGYSCSICKCKPSGKRLAVDHCHRTGVVRGLLCSNCNTVLGKMQDCPDRLRQAALYLEEFLK